MGNCQVERFNHTLLHMLGTLEEYQKSDWKAHVLTLVHPYNAIMHAWTGYPPYFLMLCRNPRLPLVGSLDLQFAHHTAQKVTQKSTAKHKATYELKVQNTTLHEDDRVLVKNVRLWGKRELADSWERTPYISMSLTFLNTWSNQRTTWPEKQELYTIKVSKGAKIRNRYNQVPHLTQDTNGKVTNSKLDTTNESQEVSPFPAGGYKAHINRRTQRHSKARQKNIKDPQKKYRLGTVRSV